MTKTQNMSSYSTKITIFPRYMRGIGEIFVYYFLSPIESSFILYITIPQLYQLLCLQ